LVEFLPAENITLSASYSHGETKDKNTGESLLRRAKDKFTANLNYRFLAKGRFVLSLIHLGAREDQEWIDWISTRVQMEPFTLLNAVGSYDIHPNVQIFLRLDNILDQQYELIKGYGTPGFSVFGGFKIQL
jgi:vitamin B12 transporter